MKNVSNISIIKKHASKLKKLKKKFLQIWILKYLKN